jgi:hypothetical protein
MTEPVSIAVAASAAASSAVASPGLLVAAGMFIAGWSFTILIALAILGILFEHNGARGWSVFITLVTAAVAYIAFNLSLLTIAIGAVAYIVIGLVWSFWRYKRHAAKVVEEKKNSTSTEKEYALRNLHPRAMLPTITAWIMIWPFSLVENLVGDLINLVQSLVTTAFRAVYHKIYDSAVASLK